MGTRLGCAAVAGLFLWASGASAAVFTDRAVFLASLQSSSTVSFEIADSLAYYGSSATISDVQFTASDLFGFGADSGFAAGEAYASDYLEWQYGGELRIDLPGSFGAVGFDFMELGGEGATFTIVVNGVSTVRASGSAPGFFGITFEDEAITSLTVSGPVFGTIDNLTYGALPSGGGAVPEPAAWALMIVGFGAAGGVLRRRRMAALA